MHGYWILRLKVCLFHPDIYVFATIRYFGGGFYDLHLRLQMQTVCIEVEYLCKILLYRPADLYGFAALVFFVVP